MEALQLDYLYAYAGLSIPDYVDLEIATDRRHEYHNGEVVAMAGGTLYHSLLCANIAGELFTALKNKNSICRAYTSEIKIAIETRDSYVYPDATVVCGQPEESSIVNGAITNPILIVEVLSPSSAGYDRNEKFELYQALSSLKEYVLIAQNKPYVEVYYRNSNLNFWCKTVFEGLKTPIYLESIDVEIKLSDLYFNLEF